MTLRLCKSILELVRFSTQVLQRDGREVGHALEKNMSKQGDFLQHLNIVGRESAYILKIIAIGASNGKKRQTIKLLSYGKDGDAINNLAKHVIAVTISVSTCRVIS